MKNSKTSSKLKKTKIESTLDSLTKWFESNSDASAEDMAAK